MIGKWSAKHPKPKILIVVENVCLTHMAQTFQISLIQVYPHWASVVRDERKAQMWILPKGFLQDG